MEGDAETVRFVAYVHQHFQRFAVAVEIVRGGVVREIDLFDPFGQSDDGDPVGDPEPQQGFVGEAELPLASVHDDQLRQFGVFVEQPAVTASDHLFHRGEVVGSNDGLDVEMAVLLARRFCVAEYDARSHRIGSL